MTSDKLDRLGPALAEIGQEVVHLAGGDPNGLFLYVEIGEGWVGPSLFKDEGSSVRYIRLKAPNELVEHLENAWCLEPADKRWTAMHFTIDEGKFAAEFDYDDLEELEDGIEDRRERILRARYGDKPVIYPPMSQGSWELQPPS